MAVLGQLVHNSTADMQCFMDWADVYYHMIMSQLYTGLSGHQMQIKWSPLKWCIQTQEHIRHCFSLVPPVPHTLSPPSSLTTNPAFIS